MGFRNQTRELPCAKHLTLDTLFPLLHDQRLLYDPDADDEILEKSLSDHGLSHGAVVDVRVDNDDENGIMSFFLFILGR